MESLIFSFIVSLLVVAFIAASGMTGGFSLPYTLFLLALALCGHFLLEQMKKSGINSPKREYLFVLAAFASYFAVLLSFSALRFPPPFLYLPIMFLIPAIAGVVREIFS